jgi:hypothetical protein
MSIRVDSEGEGLAEGSSDAMEEALSSIDVEAEGAITEEFCKMVGLGVVSEEAIALDPAVESAT